MGTRFYRFGRFRLNPQARELFDGTERVSLPLSTIDSLIYLIAHRDRPVGRDELASAVWGRTDVSEVSLSHAIMRLRRLLGDTGNEQRVIRTVPRLGYRWVLEDLVEEPESEPVPQVVATDAGVASNGATAAAALSGRRPRRIGIAAIGIIAAAALVAVAVLRFRATPTIGIRAPTPAVVLPVTLNAPPDAVWVRLGLMDLLATQLRRGGVATAPSESVVALANAPGTDHAQRGREAFPDSLIVAPHATLAGNAWSIRLDARDAKRALSVEAEAADPIEAGRKAADALLIKLGRVPPDAVEDDPALALATLRERVNAAVLSGQLDVARSLIRDAAPPLQAMPEIALSRAKVEFFSGNYEASRELIRTLLARLPPDAPVGLRGRALNTLAAAHFRQGHIDQAADAYAESMRLVERANEPDVLANAYIGSGGVASQRMRLDDAAADYGRARTLLELGNDAFGVAAVDLNLGLIALQRGQPAAALPILRGAADRFEKLAGDDALAATAVAIVDADLATLDYKDALATVERFAGLQSRGGGGRERWEFTLARARVLAATGRLGDADALLARIADGTDPKQDALLRAQADVLAADAALGRDDCTRAAESAATALTPVLEGAIPADYARGWRLRVQALACGGAPVADALARMNAWSATAPADATGIQTLLAAAAAADAAGARDEAVKRYADAMAAAAKRAIPDEIVAVALPYVRALIAAGRVDDAVSVNGRAAAWADRDARAALTQALVYRALKQTGAADAAIARARSLAGDRVFAELAATPDSGAAGG